MKRGLKSVLISILVILYTLFFKLYVVKNTVELTEIISSIFVIILFILSVHFFGYRKDIKTPLKKKIYLITLLTLIIYFPLIYLLGFVFGFLKNAYSLEIIIILKNIICPLIILIFIELFRYVFISANKDKKYLLVIITFIITVFELVIFCNDLKFSSLDAVSYSLCLRIIPCLVRNAVLNYLCYYGGKRPTILYQLLMNLYVYVVPIVPNIEDLFKIIFLIGVPFVIFYYSLYAVKDSNNDLNSIKEKSGVSPLRAILYLVIIVLFALISGIFPYSLVGIASNSMESFKRGDAVIIRKVSQKELNVGDIISYNSNGIVIVHKIVEINDSEDEIIYKTKGDKNTEIDLADIKYKDINGVVVVKVPYIAYPTILLHDLIRS